MADRLVDELKATIEKLENRVKGLEDRLHGNASSSASPSAAAGDGMRMILIGPPGAGESPSSSASGWWER